MHELEHIFPLTFTFDWEQQSATLPSLSSNIVSPKHVGTKILNTIPLPLFFIGVNQRMSIHEDKQGWDLLVRVSALDDHVHLITYEGSMRLLHSVNESHHQHSKEDEEKDGEKDEEKDGEKDEEKDEEKNETKATNNVAFDLNAVLSELDADAADPALSARPTYVEGFHDLVLFDGQCNLCNASINFLMMFDTDKRFLFCTQQSSSARSALEFYGHHNNSSGGGLLQATVESSQKESREMLKEGENDSVLVLSAEGVLLEKSDAALRAGEVLGGGWRMLSLSARYLVPRAGRDWMYDLIGRNRYKWFGKKDTCRIPTLEERQRFL